jgi:hypothetical protein
VTAEGLLSLSHLRGMKIVTDMPPDNGSVPAAGENDLGGVFEIACLHWDEPFILLTEHPITGSTVEEVRFVRHRTGDLVRLDHAQGKRLLAAGAVVHPGVREEAELAVLEAQAAMAAQQAAETRARIKRLKSVMGEQSSETAAWEAGRRNAGLTGPSVAP